MVHAVTLIPGDGIGPEVAEAMQKIIDASGAKIEWHVFDAGNDVIQRYGTPLPQETLESIMRDKVAIKGPIGTPIGEGFASVNVQLRKTLDLYANYRPAKTIKGIKSRYDDIDLIIVRENTQGLYSGLEHIVVPGVVESIRVITEKASERIVKFAFEAARKYNRKKVTAVHKANILKKSDGLFLEVARRIAKGYPEIQYDEHIVDATAMKLVMNPEKFDVLVMENLFGDIISDLTSGLIGGLGIAPSANIGEKYAVFEAVHGSAPDIAGKGLANPTALTLSAVLMLEHLGELEAATRVQNAVETVIREATHLTQDLGGTSSTTEYADAIIRAFK
ncbi:MAG: isocitrate dehydrogenase (NAD(+)) [Candidatus Sericytochromatia bacterium]